ncbi:unnamed protein product [Urochloa decumbens]|uniref:Complex III subunit 9 n=1 Tax=Urochloa decumbens TaxID=240449 RepID=A0ABC8WRS7_9POAL
MGLFDVLYRVVMRRNAVYVTFVVAGAFAGERAVDYGVHKLWEMNNVGAALLLFLHTVHNDSACDFSSLFRNQAELHFFQLHIWKAPLLLVYLFYFVLPKMLHMLS